MPAIPADAPPPLKFGILGAAKIAPSALITPAKSHPEVVIYAVAARDLGKAQKFAKDHGIEKVYGGSGAYQGAYPSSTGLLRFSCSVICLVQLTGGRWLQRLMLTTTELLNDPEIDAIYNPVRLRPSLSHLSCTECQYIVTLDSTSKSTLLRPLYTPLISQLPNGLHFEWTMKALQAGKHVLLEKPSADTAEETRQMFEFAEKKGLVLLEAFHNRSVRA